MADGFEDKTTNGMDRVVWQRSDFRPGVVIPRGKYGLGVTGLSGGPSFVSFQPQIADEVAGRVVRGAEGRCTSSFAIDPTYQLTLAAIRSASDPLFGDPDYHLRVMTDAGSLGVKAFFRLDPETWLPETYGGWVPIAGNTVLRLQVGKADGSEYRQWLDAPLGRW